MSMVLTTKTTVLLDYIPTKPETRIIAKGDLAVKIQSILRQFTEGMTHAIAQWFKLVCLSSIL